VLFFNASGSELKSKWQGGTEKQIELFFRCAEEGAKLVESGSVSVNQLSTGVWRPEQFSKSIAQNSPEALSILFMDEIDAIAGKRDGSDKTMVK
jgi:SpoVK/Ycf46/Vps4 family AAA+-type ATPase